jgi:hypothetical protein
MLHSQPQRRMLSQDQDPTLFGNAGSGSVYLEYKECPSIIFLQSHTLVTSKPPLPSLSSTGKRDNFLPGEGGGEESGRGAESYDRKKAWSSVNNSILSACYVANLR